MRMHWGTRLRGGLVDLGAASMCLFVMHVGVLPRLNAFTAGFLVCNALQELLESVW